ncbi:peptidase [Candidatus Nitrosopumilus sp. SW]|uniref:A24 family peptidase C-terminal domain-containing protein n=1 Tax=Candidatus Nitrosopumilus sp. SW TaxID=2508726 RepID=UPI00114D5334|nr:A24 family peptidase C-terminal domain-containing protein [Candidatus Nitrosopumilus sp. SW]QDI88102.1 peptidase [Candidatus Nitrosopumilus sp. SW]
MEGISDLFLIRIGLALFMLVVGGFFDIWKREVHDYVWIIFGSAGAVLLLFEPFQMNALYSTLFALIIAPISIIIWRMGLFGGADAFALIALAIIAPQMTFSENMVTPFTTLSNAAVLFIVPLLVNLVHNIISKLRGEDIFEGFEESIHKKILASLLGYRSKNPKHGFLIEKTEGHVKKIVLSLHHVDNENFSQESNTWITPGIPYLLMIAGGFLIQLAYGDLILTSLGI